MPVDVPASVVKKLLSFTVAMIALPLITFFAVQHFFTSSPIFSGASAAVAANGVLIAYIIVAFSEDTPEVTEETKKDR